MDTGHDNDILLLDTLPVHLAVGGQMLKATPATEGAERFVYIEASNEAKDQQGEKVLAQALANSADYYLKFGNLDIDHYTQIGAKRGIPDYMAYEIGVPVAVRIENGTTFVKGHIKAGSGAAAQKADLFWSSLTEVSPPERWYPSVGGAVTGKAVELDGRGNKTAVITGVRWTNIGFSKTPVNDNLSTVGTTAFGPLAKSWGAMMKGLEAGYGTDSASLTGGAALRVQSLDTKLMSYWDFRDQFANAIQTGSVADMSQQGFVAAAQKLFAIPAAHAARYVQRFLNDLQFALTKESQ
jgi:hypothetical protein